MNRPIERAAGPLAVGAWLVTRAVVYAGFAAGTLGKPIATLIAAGYTYDASWYARIAVWGYMGGDAKVAFNPGFPALTAVIFWPLAWALHVVRATSPTEPQVKQLAAASTVVAANLALVLALALLWKLYRDRLGRVATALGIGFLLTSPGALFLSIGYSESLFLALVAATFLLVERRRFGAAGLMAGVACLARPTGVLLALPLLVAWVLAPAPRSWRAAGIGTAGFIAGALAFPAFLGFVFGNPFLQAVTEKAGWGRQLTNPVGTVTDLVQTVYRCVSTLGGSSTGIRPPDIPAPIAALEVLLLVGLVTATSVRLLRPWETDLDPGRRGGATCRTGHWERDQPLPAPRLPGVLCARLPAPHG